MLKPVQWFIREQLAEPWSWPDPVLWPGRAPAALAERNCRRRGQPRKCPGEGRGGEKREPAPGAHQG